MKFVVTLTFPATPNQVEVIGPYDTAEEAEQARRRIHFCALDQNTMPSRPVITNVCLVRTESAL